MNSQHSNFLKIINTALTGNIHKLENPDFEKIVRLSYEQNISPIFLEGIVKYDFIDKIPISQKARLIENASVSVAVQSQKTAEFCSIYNQFTDAGLKPIILKGLICRETYGKFENLRSSGDEDIFIKKEEFSLCRQILEQNGFYNRNVCVSENVLDNIHTIDFESENSLLKIEVHFDFIGKENDSLLSINDFFLESVNDLSVIEYEKKSYYTLSFTYNYIYLFFHYFKHFISSGAGIRNVLDLAFFCKKNNNEIDFKFAENVISKYINPSFYADTLWIAKLLGFEIPTECKIKSPEVLCDDLLDGGAFGFNNPETFYLSTYISIKGNRRKFPLLRLIFPPFKTMCSVFPELYNKPYKLLKFYFIRIKKYFKGKRIPAFERKIFKSSKARVKIIKSYLKKQ